MINFHTQCADLSCCIWYQIFISFQFVVTVCQQKLITQGKNSFPPENQFKSKWCKIFIFFPRFLITFSPKSVSVKNAVFKQKMRINHVKYGQIVQIYHFARFTSVFSFLLTFVNKNVSLMVKTDFLLKINFSQYCSIQT